MDYGVVWALNLVDYGSANCNSGKLRYISTISRAGAARKPIFQSDLTGLWYVIDYDLIVLQNYQDLEMLQFQLN